MLVVCLQIALSRSTTNLFTAVVVKNLSSTAAEKIYIRSGATGSANILTLLAGEFTFFPWSSDEDLVYDADSGTPAMEIMVFEK